MIRFLEIDLLTGGIGTLEISGSHSDTYETMRARVEAVPGRAFVALSESTFLVGQIDGMTEEQRSRLPSPQDSVVRLPSPSEVDYDYETRWLVPRSRPSFEDAMGKTKADLVADMVARGAPLAWAKTTVDAREGEYDAYDPLEGVHPYGTSIEDIAQAAIVAAEARAARRAG